MFGGRTSPAVLLQTVSDISLISNQNKVTVRSLSMDQKFVKGQQRTLWIQQSGFRCHLQNLCLFTAIRRPFNRLPCGCFLASSFDAWKKVDRIGLYRRGPSVQRGQTRRIERGVPRVRRLNTSSVTEIHGSFALERAFEVPWLVPSDRRQPAEAACDVRAAEHKRHQCGSVHPIL